jgi:hypothetical protein
MRPPREHGELAGWLCRHCHTSLVAVTAPACSSCGGADWCLVTYPPLVETSYRQGRRRSTRFSPDATDERFWGRGPSF